VKGTVEVVESVPAAFADLVSARLEKAPERVAGGGGLSLFLSGGPTAEASYRQLAARSGPGAGDRPRADWTAVDVYLGDERCVPPDHPDSNHRMVAEVLLAAVGPVRSDHPMYRSGSPEAAAADYQRLLDPLGPFDVVHLGMGPDGHCASLFPDSAALCVEDPAVLVMANRDPHAHNPHDRITLTLAAIARARLVVFTVSGDSKRDAFRQLVAGDDLPAGRVTAGEVIWLADTAAVGDTRLPEPTGRPTHPLRPPG
jgi:6-phosphogluconolactonase